MKVFERDLELRAENVESAFGWKSQKLCWRKFSRNFEILLKEILAKLRKCFKRKSSRFSEISLKKIFENLRLCEKKIKTKTSRLEA